MSLNLKPTSVIKANLGILPSGPVHKYFQDLCYRYMNKYVPRDEGNLRKNVDLSDPNYIIYNSRYAHFIYKGILYVDPVTGSPLARKGVTKIPTGTPLKYHYAGTGHHWDERMKTAEMNDVINKVQQYVNRGGK